MESKTTVLRSILIGAVAATLLWAAPARADGTTFGFIAPHEWDFPVEFKPFSAVVQYGWLSSRSDAFDADGDKVDMGGDTTSLVGLSKFAYFFQLDALPKVGWAAVAVVPEISVRGDSLSASGIGDPMFAFPVVWFRPVPQLLLGGSYWLSVPWGSDDVSNHYWSHMPLAFADLNVGPVNVDLDVGYSFNGTAKKTNADDFHTGDTFFTNVRLAYRDPKHGFIGKFEPFVALDYQRVSSSETMDGADMTNSKSNELAFGGGLGFYPVNSVSIHLSYRRSVDGENTPVGDMAYFKVMFIP